MCGIAAILFYPMPRQAPIRREIGEFFTRNLLFNEERGKAATGFAVLNNDGSLSIHKEAVPASRFVKSHTYHEMLASLDDNTTLWLGHTRLPTKGAPGNNDNNHPILARQVVGVHNGTVTNDEALFLQWGYSRKAEVDSEIIFRLLSDINPYLPIERYAPAACQRVQLMQGKYTFLAAHQSQPQRLLVLKHHNPLCMHYHAPWQALIFSSRYIFLRKAFGKIVITEALPHNRLLLYDAMRIPALGNTPAYSCTLGKATT